jgi:hemerythrin
MPTAVYFKWDEKDSVDDATLDEEHKMLYSLANMVQSFTREDFDKKAVVTGLKSLFEYAAYHFRREEAYLDLIQYPERGEHHIRHLEIINSMNITLQSSKNMANLLKQFRILVREWVIEHIRKEDRKYADFARRQQV